MSAREISALQQQVLRLREQINQRPTRIPTRGGGSSSSPETLVSILGGNTLGSGAYGIKYVSTLPVVDKFYDPDVDTVFPNGLGYAKLYVDGVLSPTNVIVMHDWLIYRMPLISGLVLPVRGSVTLTITPVPENPPLTITALLVGVYRK